MRKLLFLTFISLAFIFVTQAQDKPEREIYTVLHYGDAVFEPDVWLASAGEEDIRSNATWRADSLGAVAFATYLHFDDGVPADVMTSFFNDDWFKTTFTNYTGYHELEHCDAQGMTLYEFSVLVNDAKYMMRYWIQPINDTRILAFFIVLPTTDEKSLDKYAALLYPDFASCKQVSS